MRPRSSYVLIFVLFLGITLFFGIIFTQPFFTPVRGGIEGAFLPFQRGLYTVFQREDTSELQKVKEENRRLSALLVKQKDEEREMQALKDQFAISSDQSHSLLPATIVGRRDDDVLIIDQGSTDRIIEGMHVFVKESYLGTITEVTPHLAVVHTVSKPTTSITAKTVNTNANGIIRGVKEGHMILDHVILSDALTIGDMVITKGETDTNGTTLPPGSVIGKIISVDRKTSDLFQSAKVQSLIDFSHVSTVFVLLK